VAAASTAGDSHEVVEVHLLLISAAGPVFHGVMEHRLTGMVAACMCAVVLEQKSGSAALTLATCTESIGGSTGLAGRAEDLGGPARSSGGIGVGLVEALYAAQHRGGCGGGGSRGRRSATGRPLRRLLLASELLVAERDSNARVHSAVTAHHAALNRLELLPIECFGYEEDEGGRRLA